MACLSDVLNEQGSSGSLTMLVCGRVGVGKSRFINHLVGAKVRKLKHLGLQSTESDPVEKEIVKAINVEVEIYDTSGLQGYQELDGKILDDISLVYKDVDIILYCIDMTVTRWSPEETNALSILTRRLGEDMWNKSILVLTKADKVHHLQDEYTDSDNEKLHFERVFTRLLQRFHSELTKLPLPVPQKIAEEVPAVATSSRKHLPNGQDFISALWDTCRKRCPPDKLKRIPTPKTLAYFEARFGFGIKV